MGGTPWSFDKLLFAIAVTDGTEDPREVSLKYQFFWLRIRGLPPAVMEEHRRAATGNYIGDAIGTHVRTGYVGGRGVLGQYLRIRVGINIQEPLRKGISFRLAGEPIGK